MSNSILAFSRFLGFRAKTYDLIHPVGPEGRCTMEVWEGLLKRDTHRDFLPSYFRHG